MCVLDLIMILVPFTSVYPADYDSGFDYILDC